MELSTRAVHAGLAGPETEPGRPASIPTSVPIDPSTTFRYARTDELAAVAAGAPGYMYARWANPTVAALEHAVADLEGAAATVAFGSGMAALHAAILAAGIGPSECVVCAGDIYGGTIGLLRQILIPLGVDVRFADFTRPEMLDAALAGPGVKLVMAETVSNPRLRVADIASLAAKAHAAGAKLLVDATFATPALFRPLALGADYVVHSTTKCIAGHGDAMGGVVTARAVDAPALFTIRKLVGGILGPFEAWLTLRGLKTLPLRLGRQCQSAAHIAATLAQWPTIERVHYPGLSSHPDYATAARQFSGQFGGVLSFEVRGADRAGIVAFMNKLRLCLPGTSLGDVQSLVLHPVMASHRDLSPQQRERIGIRDNLVRLSVGIEDPADLLADLEQALR